MKRFLDWLLNRHEETPAERLHRMVMERRNSFEIMDYRKRRAAMLKAVRK